MLNSCQKTERISNTKAAETEKQKIIELTKERYGNVGASIVFQPHTEASYIGYRDQNGNLIQFRQNRTTATCIAGSNVICTPPGSYTATTNQEVEYRLKDQSSNRWEDQTSTPHGGCYPGTTTEVHGLAACCDVLNFLLMTYQSGTWMVRYRNRYTGCSSYSANFTTSWLDANGNGNYILEIWTI